MNIDLSDCGIFKIRVAFDYIGVYNPVGSVIHFKHKNVFEEWWKYDSNNNNKIHYKNSFGYELWNRYNIQNIMIHKKEINIGEKT